MRLSRCFVALLATLLWMVAGTARAVPETADEILQTYVDAAGGSAHSGVSSRASPGPRSPWAC